MYLGQMTRYDILYAVKYLARVISNPSKAHMAVTKHLLRYLAGREDFAITFKQGGFKLNAFYDANWGNNPSNGGSMSSCTIMLSNAPMCFKVKLQGLTAQFTMEAELVGAALMMKESVLCSNLTKERQRTSSVHRQHLGSAHHRQPDLHLSGNARGSEVQELVKKGQIQHPLREGRGSIR